MLALALGCAAIPTRSRADEASATVYVRADTDHTTVIAPRVRAQADVAESTKATVIYAVDVWTSASIDIMASASKVPVTEQRDELDVSIDHELEDLTFTAAYRYSVEPDYVSHGGSGGLSFDFADNNATAALGLSGSRDSVGRAGDPTFSRDASTLGGRLSFTQVMGKQTVTQLMYEVSRVTGYQASPYRFVAVGGGVCTVDDEVLAVLAPTCVSENMPGERLRHAIALELRQALGERWSLSGAYRFYLDDWGLLSHTLRAELARVLDHDTLLSLRYRFYVQGAADHYRASYTTLQGFVTSDKELSPMTVHRVGLELDRVWPFADGSQLTTTLSLAPLFYAYSDFPPLTSITAYEVTAGMVYVP